MRVTRKRWRSTISMPGKRSSRLAAMTCSRSTKRARLDLQQARQDRRHLDAGEDPLAGVRVAHPDGEREAEVVMYGNGCPGSTASGVRTGKISSRKRWRSSAWCSGTLLVVDDADAFVGERPAEVAEDRPSARRRARRTRVAAAAELLGRRSGRPAARASAPAATCCFRPATRTWKNSSRLLAKMARNRTPLEQRVRGRRAPRRGRAR